MNTAEIQRSIVRQIAELASASVPWGEIERIVRELGDQHGVDVETLLVQVRSAIVVLLRRQLETGECRCWACRGVA